MLVEKFYCICYVHLYQVDQDGDNTWITSWHALNYMVLPVTQLVVNDLAPISYPTFMFLLIYSLALSCSHSTQSVITCECFFCFNFTTNSEHCEKAPHCIKHGMW